jgi:tetratricopeptide (TPR) repeat protein
MSLRIFSALLLSGCLLPLTAAGEDYLYEGQVTFETLTGKDCGDFKPGDSLAIELAIRTQDNGLSGYSRLQGNDPVSLKGQDEAHLTLRSADPADVGGHTLALSGTGQDSLTGQMAERMLAPDQSGCNLSLGAIAARLIGKGVNAGLKLQKMDTDFRMAQEGHAARIRDPEAFAEIMRIARLAEQAASPENGDPAQALVLFEQLQSLYGKVYGEGGQHYLMALSAQAKILTRMAEYERALVLGRKVHDLAKAGLPSQVATAAYVLGDLLEKMGRKEEALVFFTEARLADEKEFGADHPEVAADLVREADLLEELGRNDAALTLRERVVAIRMRAQEPNNEATSQAMWKLASLLRNMERHQQALRWYQAELALAETLHGREHADTANSIEGVATSMQSLGRYSEALALFEQGLSIRLRLFGEEHALTARSLRDIAGVYRKLGQYAAALQHVQRALGIDEKVLGLMHRDTAHDLNLLGLTYKDMGRLGEALDAQLRVLPIYESVLGTDHPESAVGLLNLGATYQELGEYNKALPLYQRALAINEKTIGLDHVDTATTLGNLGLYYKTIGEFDIALTHFRKALAIDEKVLGDMHPDTANDLNNLASLHVSLGQFEQARTLHLRALAIREQVLGREHVATRTSLNNLGILHEKLGEYEQALAYHSRALAIAESVLGPDHPETAGSLNNLAVLYGEIGQFDKALAAAQRVLAIYEKSLGAKHLLTATALGNLGVIHERSGRHAEALQLAQRALAIREKSLASDHVDIAANLNNLATLYKRTGDFRQAEASFLRSLGISELKYGADHAETAVVINNLAMVYGDMGRHDEALALLRRALRIRESVLGEAHKFSGATVTNLAFAEAAANQFTRALASFDRGNVIAGKVIERVFSVANEKEKLAYVQQQEWGYFGELSLIHRHFSNDQRALRMGLDLVLARKGIVFDAQARQNEALAGSLDAEARAMWDELGRLRSQQSQLLQSKPVATRVEAYLQQQRQIEAQIGKIELALSGRSALVADQLKQRSLTSAVVAENLPPGGVLAEFIKIDDYDWTHNRWTGNKHYLAFLLHPDKRIDLIDLGDADILEQALREPLRQLDRIGLDNELQQAAARKLHQVLWQPLEQAAGQAKSVIFSPDGVLNLAPFAAMLDADGRFFIERRMAVYVTSGRELARGDANMLPDSLLYLAANPDFDRNAPGSGQIGAITRSAGFNLRFESLPGTQEEADFIPVLLPGKQRIVTGRNATESSVLGAGRPRVMHLATHGFFLADQMHASAGTRGAMALEDEAPVPVVSSPARQENPLLRSGLALAGANHASQAGGGDDGLLTALEVSGMNLHGTDLVTLSACETGRGDVKSGEGVFGLRRAFALSGARHLVMSLWPVGDEATAQQMRVFYRQYGSGARPAEALRTAQLASIEALRAQGKVAEPALWAPFIAQGW